MNINNKNIHKKTAFDNISSIDKNKWTTGNNNSQTDQSYWETPLLIRIYMRIFYASCGALLISWILDSFKFVDWLQWLFGVFIFVYILVFRWIHPNGFNDIYKQLLEGNVLAIKELERGDYTGVPTFLIPEKDRDKVQKERQKKLK